MEVANVLKNPRTELVDDMDGWNRALEAFGAGTKFSAQYAISWKCSLCLLHVTNPNPNTNFKRSAACLGCYVCGTCESSSSL